MNLPCILDPKILTFPVLISYHSSAPLYLKSYCAPCVPACSCLHPLCLGTQNTHASVLSGSAKSPGFWPNMKSSALQYALSSDFKKPAHLHSMHTRTPLCGHQDPTPSQLGVKTSFLFPSLSGTCHSPPLSTVVALMSFGKEILVEVCAHTAFWWFWEMPGGPVEGSKDHSRWQIPEGA